MFSSFVILSNFGEWLIDGSFAMIGLKLHYFCLYFCFLKVQSAVRVVSMDLSRFACLVH